MNDVNKTLPLEYETLRLEIPPKKEKFIRIKSDRLGEIRRVFVSVDAVFETKMHRVSGVLFPEYTKLLTQHTVQFMVDITDELNPAQIENCVFNQSGVRFSPPEDFWDKLQKEADSVMDKLHSSIKKVVAKFQKRKDKRLTGDGAESRIRKFQEIISESCLKLNGLDPDLMFELIKFHASTGSIGINYRGYVNLGANEQIVEYLEKNQINVLDLIRYTVYWSTSDSECVKKVFSHSASNPTHVNLLKRDHIVEAINMASIKNVMNS